MAYPILPGDLIELSIRSVLFGQKLLNILHYRVDTVVSPIADGAAALQAWLTLLATSDSFPVTRLSECMSQQGVIREIRAQLILSGRRAYETKDVTIVGTVAEDSFPPSTAVCIAKRTELAGAQRQGRLEASCVPLTFVTDGLVSADGNSAYTLLGVAIKAKASLGVGNTDNLVPTISRADSSDIRDITECVVRQNVRALTRRTVRL